MRGWTEVTTLGDLVVRGAALHGDADALVFPDGRMSYRELEARAYAAARSLRGLGVGPGDRVGVLMPNCLTFMEVTYGAALLGAVVVLINSRYRGAELAYVIQDADVVVLVTSDLVEEHVDHVARLHEAFPGLDAAPDVRALALDPAPELRATVLLGTSSPPGFVDQGGFEDAGTAVTDAEVETLRRRIAVRSVGMMMYTSGTTARPKGCLMTHEMVVRNGIAVGRRFELTPEDRFWDPLPMFHMSAILPMTGCFFTGCAFMSMTHFEAGTALAMMERERATVFYPTFPTITMAVLNHPEYATRDLSRIRLIINVAPPDTLRKMQEQMPQGVQVTAYGSTEMGGVACFNELSDTIDQRVTTSGRPFPGIELRIAGPDGQTLGPGEEGEICARGYSLFEGYHKDPDKTAEVMDADGWFHSGDIGTLDEDGRVSYVGRLKDMLKVGGENVAAAEIEALLQDHPAVSIAQVIGIPDDRLVEVPVAFVELRPGRTATPEELVAHCKGKLASFKVPREVRVVTEWPMSATKIQKFRLRELLTAEPSAPPA